jgi:hypothetical protein
MHDASWIAALSSVAFAAAALAIQLASAWGGGRRDLSAPAGSAARGVLFNFTLGMAPGHKETARLHPVKFAIGVAMHVGVVLAILRALVLLAAPGLAPPFPIALAALFGASAACGAILFVRRLVVADLRGMSSFEDYFSALMTIGFLVASSLEQLGGVSRSAFFACAAALFFYLPLGKLRHAAFFFAARADYGRRLGHRGVYPPPPRKERSLV